jgi:hypothetical protein
MAVEIDRPLNFDAALKTLLWLKNVRFGLTDQTAVLIG